MRPRFAASLAVLAVSISLHAPLSAQDDDPADDGPVRCGWGVSLGNSRCHAGLRINTVDEGVRRVDGVNLTLWRPRKSPDFQMNGLAVGLVGPMAGEINGIALGGLAVIAESDLRGASAGGLAVIAEGRMQGIHAGGLAVIAEGGIDGIAVGGLASINEGSVRGVSIGGLASISDGDVTGVSIGGLATISDGSLTGLNVGGLATISDGPVRGVNVGGLAVIADGPAEGINVGGLAVITDQTARWLSVAGLAVIAEEVEGVSAAGYVRTSALNGLSVAAHNDVRGRQNGVAIGIYNYARELKGVQLGLLNYVRSNPKGLRLLPIFNTGF
jgi:hypothetical protein